MDHARRLAQQRNCDVVVVGAANVGKSSLINRLSKMDGGSQAYGHHKQRKKAQAKGLFRKKGTAGDLSRVCSSVHSSSAHVNLAVCQCHRLGS